MSVLDNAKQFEKMVGNLKFNKSDSDKLLESAQKFNKIAQQSNTNGARKALVKLLVNQWSAAPRDFPISAREELSPLMYPQKAFTPEELKNSASKIYKILMESKNKNTMSFAQNQLMEHINNLDNMIASGPSIPAPTQSTIPEVNVEDLPKTNTSTKQYPSIARETQQKLNQILGSTIKVDGLLGPETQNALNTFKTKFNLKNLSPSDLMSKIQNFQIGNS